MAPAQNQQALHCVGSSCAPPPPPPSMDPSSSSPGIGDEASWNAVLKAAGEAAVTLKEAINSLKESGSASNNKQNSGHMRQARPVMMKAIIARLTKVSSHLMSLQAQIRDLKEKAIAFKKSMKNQEDSAPLDVMRKVDDLASTMQEALKRLQDDETRNKVEAGNLKDSKRMSLNVSKPSTSKSFEFGKGRMDMIRLAENEEQIRIENEKLKKELEVALAAVQAETSALEQVERYKEVIARVTADNMVFLMKLKESEQALTIAQEQQSNLMKQLETSRVRVLEDVSAEIEDTVMTSLSKAEACEKELQILQRDYERKEKEWQEKLQEAKDNFYQTQIITERLTELEEERLQILSQLEQESKAKENAEAKARNLYNDLQSLQEQMLKLRADHMQEKEDIQAKLNKLEMKEHEMDELAANLDRTTSQLKTQQAINVVLMKKKEEMEWLFLEAKAEKENLQKQCRSLIHS